MRSNNNNQHISSLAKDTELNPTGTNFPITTTDLQTMAELIQPQSLVPWEDLKATETEMGILRIATNQEVLDGIVSDAIVTPSSLENKWIRPNASETVKGLVRFATSAERTEAAKSVSIGIHTSGVWDIIRNRSNATTSLSGTVKLTTIPVGIIGTDTTSATSPAVVKAMIDTFAVTAVTTVSSASETVTGTVKISPSPVINVALHAGVAVSPKGFIETRANQTRVGTTKFATQAKANARSATDLALAPATLPIATTSQAGITTLANAPQSGATNKAISAHAATDFVSKSLGGTMTADLTARSLYISTSQPSAGNSVTRKDWVESQVTNLTTLINGRLPNNAVFKRLNRLMFTLFDYSGGLGSGNFTISDRWDNYDGIIFVGSGDDKKGFVSKSWDKYELNNMQRYVGYHIFNSDSIYWYGKFASDARTFNTIGENSRIWRVLGYRDVFSKA